MRIEERNYRQEKRFIYLCLVISGFIQLRLSILLLLEFVKLGWGSLIWHLRSGLKNPNSMHEQNALIFKISLCVRNFSMYIFFIDSFQGIHSRVYFTHDNDAIAIGIRKLAQTYSVFSTSFINFLEHIDTSFIQYSTLHLNEPLD